MSTRSILPTFITVVLATMPAGAAPPTAGPREVAVDEKFKLHLDEAAAVSGRPLRLGLEGIVSDSRCPKGEQCVQAGEVRVQVWLQQGSAARECLELVQWPGRPPHPVAWPGAGLSVVLLDLQPAPVVGLVTAPSDYRATLKVSAAPVAAALTVAWTGLCDRVSRL